MQYFTADIHFADMISMQGENRPFKNIRAYDKFIIKDWNKTAKKGDTIYVLGDVLDCNGENTEHWKVGLSYIKKIKADVVLIIGNNEERVIRYFFNNSFEDFANYCVACGVKSVHKSLEIFMRGQKFNLVHQVIHANKDMINLFGHTHISSGLYHPYGLCLSTDLNHFRLYTEDLIFGYLKRKHDWWDLDDNLNYPNPFLKKVQGKWVNIRQSESKDWKEYKKYNS